MMSDTVEQPKTRQSGTGYRHVASGGYPELAGRPLPRRSASASDVLYVLEAIPSAVWNAHPAQWGAAQAAFESILMGRKDGLDLAWASFAFAVETAGIQVPDGFFD